MSVVLPLMLYATVAAAPTNELPLEELQALTDAMARIKATYVEDVDDKKLLEGAITGMLATLDPHSSYLSGKTLQRLSESSHGSYGGVGMEVLPVEGEFRVVTPMDDSPAKRAGVLSGDVIVRINGESVHGWKFEKVIESLRGEPGSTVTVQFEREGVAAPIDLKLTRAEIQTKSVRHELMDNGVGYLRVSQFQVDSADEMLRSIAALEQEFGKSLRGLVLDLRNNPGGVLRAAIDMSDAFLTEGVLVSTKGRMAGTVSEARADPEQIMAGVPIVVLINEGSASASEIVAGALQDHGRAVIVGARSFGKGSVQTVQRLNADSAIKLTTARYYTPNGRSIQAKGIMPDVLVPSGKWVADEQPTRREADLPRSLQNTDSEDIVVSPSADDSIWQDTQLATAINLLHGLAALQKTP